MEEKDSRHVCCPICGHEFDEVKDTGNICPTPHYGVQTFDREQLIGSDDDYAWVE